MGLSSSLFFPLHRKEQLHLALAYLRHQIVSWWRKCIKTESEKFGLWAPLFLGLVIYRSTISWTGAKAGFAVDLMQAQGLIFKAGPDTQERVSILRDSRVWLPHFTEQKSNPSLKLGLEEKMVTCWKLRQTLNMSFDHETAASAILKTFWSFFPVSNCWPVLLALSSKRFLSIAFKFSSWGLIHGRDKVGQKHPLDETSPKCLFVCLLQGPLLIF